MPRFSLNLRPKYGPGDEPWQASLGQGISNAIAEYQRKKEVGRQEANQVAAEGGVPITAPPDPSIGDRMHTLGGAIGDVLHGRRPHFDTGPSISGNQRDGVAPGTPSALPPGAPVPNPVTPSPETRAGRMAPPPAMRSSMPATRTPAATIGSAIQPYTYEGITGQKYSVDPLYRARVAATGQEMVTSAHEEESIRALVAAGMPPAEARARVLTNTVRYDQEFGMQGRGGGGSRLTFEQRQQLQNENNAIRLQIARMAAAGRTNTAEYRQAALRLRESEDRIRADEAVARGLSGEAAGVERQVPQGVNRIVVESQPGGKERLGALSARADSLRAQARDVRGKNAQRFQTGTAASTFTPDQTRARALALKNQGYSKSAAYEMMKREGYNVAPPR